jgi:predicted small secreted protein
MKKTALTFIAIELLFILLFAFFLSSCKTTGYGCKGKASWNDVVRKANRMY